MIERERERERKRERESARAREREQFDKRKRARRGREKDTSDKNLLNTEAQISNDMVFMGHLHAPSFSLPITDETLLHDKTEAQEMQLEKLSLPVKCEKVFAGHSIHKLRLLPTVVLYVPAGHSWQLESLVSLHCLQ